MIQIINLWKENSMRLTRTQLKRMIISEINELNSKDSQFLNEGGVGLKDAKKLYDYLVQKGMKHLTPFGIAAVMTTYGEEIIDLVAKDDLEGAMEKFMAHYNAL